MGDPKRFVNKFSKPNHPWNKARIDKEREISKTYGLNNKKELWKMVSVLADLKDRTKNLTKRSGPQAEKEREELVSLVKKYGLLTEGSMDSILGLEVEHVMDRRLQTVLKKRLLARTTKQARQMITHGHVTVNGKKITSPSYLVSIDEEKNIGFTPKSAFFSEEHPERKLPEKVEEVKKETKKEEAVLIDPEEAKTDFVKDTNEETLVESLNPEEKEALEKAKEAAHPHEETKAEQIEEAIEKSEKVAEGKPAPDDEAKEDAEETPGDLPEKGEEKATVEDKQ
jgi:small subunit ribosomal protein S4